MTAHKMPDGRWSMWLDLGSDPATGKRLRRKVEAKTKREAEMKAAAIRDRHARGENVFDKPRTLKELLNDWLATIAHQGKAANTITAYRRAAYNQIVPKLGATSIPKLRTREIQTVFNGFADRLAPTYIRLLKTVLVQALDLAIEHGDITNNPAEKIRTPIVKHKPGRSLLPGEVRAVLQHCAGHRYGLAVQLGLMGLRRGELPGLRWGDFDPTAGTLTICRQIQRIDRQWVAIEPKDDSGRLLTLGPKLIAALHLHRRAQLVEQKAMGWEDSGYIFISTKHGGICPPSTIYEAFKAIAAAAGIDTARLHDLRHTAATTLLGEGEGIATVAEVLGHASPQVTAAVYAHALPHKVAQASRRLEDLYSNSDLPQQEAEYRRKDVV
jgi:integrase